MEHPMHPLDRAAKWTPRVLAILYAAFLSIFAADVFEETSGFWTTLYALTMHLVPTFVIVAALLAAWRREWVGVAAFPALGALYVFWAWGRFPVSVYLVIAGPLVVLGALYAFAWARRRARAADV